MMQRCKVSKCCWKNGTCRVATNLYFVKNATSAKHNKAKCDKTRCACTVFGEGLLPARGWEAEVPGDTVPVLRTLGGSGGDRIGPEQRAQSKQRQKLHYYNSASPRAQYLTIWGFRAHPRRSLMSAETQVLLRMGVWPTE